MATLPNSSRLFAKVAKFVRNPGVHWSDLDKLDAEPDPEPEVVTDPTLAHNRQTLKDMIDRKRHEDAIRKREFDELRQLRREAALAKPEPSDKTSTFGSATNLSDLDDRAMTLRKIDEIEAQMSKQWWKGQKPGPQAEAVPAPPSPAPAASDDSLFASTQVKHSRMDFDDIPTMLGQVQTLQTGISSLGSDMLSSADAQRPVTDERAGDGGKLPVSELNDHLSDPDLEEAAVRFANGDDAGAEAVLLTALRAQHALTAVVQAQAEALFDLYRSLGQQAGFEREASNFARQFNCSAPVWMPLPEAPGFQQAAQPQALAWRSPAQLDVPALASLPDDLPLIDCLSLNWSDLKEITAPAAQRLATLFAAWSTQQGCLVFQDEQVLVQLVRAATPRGARQAAAFWWALRMDLLRVLQWQDDFELAAFEYCMTFEAAPSPWLPASCVVCPSASAGATASAPQAPVAASARPYDLVLAGEFVGDVLTGLPALDDVSQHKQTVVISCHALIRADFSAAGSILNWVAQGQALGHQIEFRDVPFLVAAFFNLIGINQHARVLTRSH
ncbi:STAS domain-containing protein [Hydrogenophaga sp.]|uniref:STAS domain-containing protein n=1 Tax=Hydrogenophaga sp. TaxID=1904254 RepID=UPI003BB149A3